MFKVDIQRDIFGDKYLSCIINGREYWAKKHCNGGWKIYEKVNEWYVTDAKLSDPVLLWEDIPVFPNMSQAFKFLRKKAGKLL